MKMEDLIEMMMITDDFVGYDRSNDFKIEFNSLKLLEENIGPLKNKLFHGIDIFYLTDSSNNYLAHLEYEQIDDEKIMTTNSFSKFRGFYELLFKIVLAKTNIKMIFGGEFQSLKAIGAWKKQLAKFKKKVYNRETKEVEEFETTKEDDYWTKNDKVAWKYLVGISESENSLKYRFDVAKKYLSLNESRGRKGIPKIDILVMHYGFDNDTAQQMIITSETLSPLNIENK